MKRKELSPDNIADTIATLALAGRISEDLADILIELANRVSKLEQEPKTGHWIDIDGGVECDKCGKWYPHAPIAKNEIKFCSECGAKMVEPQERSGKE